MSGEVSAESAAVKASAGRVGEAEATLASWVAEESAACAELEDLQGRVGAEVLDDAGAAARLTAQLTALRTRVEVARSAVVEASRRLDVALERRRRAEAAELRADADRLDAEATELDRQVEKHLAAAQEVQGVRFGVAEVFDATSGSARGMKPFTRSQQLRMQAEGKRRKAEALDVADGVEPAVRAKLCVPAAG